MALKTHEWRRFLIEGVVIVFSILLAFAIDAWWDRRTEMIEESIALQDLQVELQQNLDAINNIWSNRQLPYFVSSIEILRAIHGLPPLGGEIFDGALAKLRATSDWSETLMSFYVSHALEPIVRRQLLASPVEISTRFISRAGRSATYGPSLASLDVLFQSGSVGRIQDPELRSRLSALPLELNDLRDEENLLMDYVWREVRPALNAASDGSLLATLIPRGLPRSLAPIALEQYQGTVSIQPSRELAQILSIRLEQNLLMLGQLGSIKANYEELLKLIANN